MPALRAGGQAWRPALLFLQDAVVVPGAVEAAVAAGELEAGVFVQIEVEADAALRGVGIDSAFELLADQVFEVAEELLGEHEGGAPLHFGLDGREDVMRAAVTLGDRRHAIFAAEDARLTAAEFDQSSAAQFDGIVIGRLAGLCAAHLPIIVTPFIQPASLKRFQQRSP